MNITDETLSAFLDSELTDEEMEVVRDRLEADPALADRLAEMASVDAKLQAHYGSIGDRPMPESITRMLQEDSAESVAAEQNIVVTFPWWRTMRGHAGKAVAAAVIAGVVLVQWSGMSSNGDPAWQEVAQVLESQPSGQRHPVNSQADNGAVLTPRLTFRNQDGEWCRQFRLVMDNTASEQIACRTEAGAWESIARVESGTLPDTGNYQTASGGKVLDETLDRIMADSSIGPETESALLGRQWRD